MRRLLPFIACIGLGLASCAVGVNTGASADGGDDDGGGQTADGAVSVSDAAAAPSTDAGVRDAKGKDTSPPTVVDSATDCPGYALPSETAACSACQSSSPTCQPNGCFNGYYCNLSTDKCGPKPSGC